MLNTPKHQKSLVSELAMAMASSLFAGFGAVFVFNLAGNYL